MGTKSQADSPSAEYQDVKQSDSAASSTADDGVSNTGSPSVDGEGESEDSETLESVIAGAMGAEDGDEEGVDGDEGKPKKPEGEDEDDAGEPGDQDEGDDEASKNGDKPRDGDEDEADDDGSDVEPGQKVPYERFQKVIQQRNTLREETEQLKTGAERDRQLTQYMQTNQISGEELVDALDFVALLKTDPSKALERIQPVVSQLNQHVGRELPPDLQERVNTGEIDQRDAEELVRSRNEAERLRRVREQEGEQRTRSAQVQRTQELRRANGMAADKEVATLRDSDPDFSAKEPWLVPEVRALLQEKPPRTPDESRALVREAYDNVSKRLRSTLGGTRRQQRREVDTASGSGAPRGNQAEPETLGEAIQLAASGQS